MRRMIGMVTGLVLAAATLGTPAPASAAPFAWQTCDGASDWAVQQLSVTPHPIAGDGAALPFRWELAYDPVTKAITRTEFHVGAPVDAASAVGLLLRFPVAGNVVGSTTYAATPSGLPVTPRTYTATNVTAGGETASWAMAVGGDSAPTAVDVRLDKKVFGVWVEIPAVDAHGIDDLRYVGPGDFHLRTALRDAGGKQLLCTETYFTNADTGTAPIVLRPETFAFSGFAPPVDDPPTVNTVKAGSSVPVKFSLRGDQGLAVFAAGSPSSERTSCSTGAGVDEIEQTATAGSSGLRYDAATDTYTYAWKTEKGWANTCRTLHLGLRDGTDHRAAFRFR